MATLAPPPPSTQKKPAPAQKKGAPLDPNWMRRLTRSGYFLGAVLFHLILALVLATIVIFRAPTPPPDDFEKAYVPSAQPPPPPPSQPQTMQVTTAVTPPTTVITTLNPTAATFTMAPPDLVTPTMSQTAKTTMQPIKSPNHLLERLNSIRDTETKNWGRSVENIMESGGDPRNVVADFPIYVASYQDGDWNCNIHMSGGQIDAGSMPDLIFKVNEWSHGNLKGHVEPQPLAIGGPDLLAKKPPFIFFTGHKDFQLTDQEVQNLRDYLQDGGAIWGDNALAGKGSRFDIAFKQEMKRVIPDIDKNWEDMPMTADLFTKSWFKIDKLPEGMNYYDEPVQHIDIDGKLAILYTPNDYSDLLYMLIEPGDAQAGPWFTTPTQPLFTDPTFWFNRIFFRNFTLESSLGAHRLGMNILAHLLVRFDSDLQLAP
jgi:uncharacterized protein DUF4159